jgi:hypothetical protein
VVFPTPVGVFLSWCRPIAFSLQLCSNTLVLETALNVNFWPILLKKSDFQSERKDDDGAEDDEPF